MQGGPGNSGPRSGGRILDLAFNIYFRNLTSLAGAAAVVVAPLVVLLVVLNVIAFAEPGPLADPGFIEIGGTTREVDFDRFTAIAVATGVISALAYLLIIGSTYRAASEAYLGREPAVAASVRFAGRRAHSILWVSLLTVLAIAVGLIAFLIGALFVGVALAVAIPALLVEDLRGTKALRRSYRLVEGNWARTFGVLFVSVAFTILLQLIAGIVAEAANPLAAEQINVWVLVRQIVDGIALAFTASFSAVVATVIYYDLRIRKEGFDIELLTDRLESPEPSSTPSPSGGGLDLPPSPPPPPGAGADERPPGS